MSVFDDVYRNAYGTEHFLSVEDEARTTVLAFLRLRLPDGDSLDKDEKTQRMRKEVSAAFPELTNAAFIRELHTYGQALKVKDSRESAVQHQGWGKVLMKEAERIAKEKGYTGLAVISGIGVRQYYRKQGFRLRGTYMVKTFKKKV